MFKSIQHLINSVTAWTYRDSLNPSQIEGILNGEYDYLEDSQDYSELSTYSYSPTQIDDLDEDHWPPDEFELY